MRDDPAWLRQLLARVRTRYHAITCTARECDPTCEIGDPTVSGGTAAAR